MEQTTVKLKHVNDAYLNLLDAILEINELINNNAIFQQPESYLFQLLDEAMTLAHKAGKRLKSARIEIYEQDYGVIPSQHNPLSDDFKDIKEEKAD